MEKLIKCIVWDLDNTLWDGVLLEGDPVELRPGIGELLTDIDSRGVLHSIASRNDHDLAWRRLRELGVDHWFLEPRIGFGSKAQAVEEIAGNLNIGLDSLLFVDDDPLERAHVSSVHPQVRTLDAALTSKLADHSGLPRGPVTVEASRRRLMYVENQRRTQVERDFDGPPDQLLEMLRLDYTVRRAQDADIERAEELTVRTNQLNSTGRTYDAHELRALLSSPEHDLLVMELTDKFGSYGVVGLALIRREEQRWTIKLLLTSCRVMSRGAGALLLAHIAGRAADRGVRCAADFVHTGRNRTAYALFRLGGFTKAQEDGDGVCLELPHGHRPPLPPHQNLTADW